MTDIRTPIDASGVTPEWLTGVLRASGALAGSVETLEATPIGEGLGFVSQVHRVVPRYAAPEAQAPASVVVKLVSANGDIRALATMIRAYEVEARFYQVLASRVCLRTPRVYAAAFDAATGAFALVLEDMSALRAGDNVAGCTLAEAETVIREAARLHAQWWDSPEAEGQAWLPTPDDPVRRMLTLQAYPFAWQALRATSRRPLPPAVVDAADALVTKAPAVLDGLARKPWTLIHGDYRLDNMFFDPDGSVVLVDWQATRLGRPAFDVAYFLSWNLDSTDLRRHSPSLLRLYYDELRREGVDDYEADTLDRDFRLAVLGTLAQAVILSTTVDVASGRAEALAAAYLERVSTLLEAMKLDDIAG